MLEKIKNTPDSVKSAIAFTISALFLRGIAFITTPVFTRIMTTTQYGIVSTYNSWQTILEVFALLGLTSAGVFNVGLNDYRENRDKYMSSILLLCNVATVFFFVIVTIVAMSFGDDVIMPFPYLGLMFLFFFFSPAQIFWITRQRYEYKYKLAPLVSISTAILVQAVSIIFVKYSEPNNSAYVKIASTVIVSIITYIPFYILLFKRGKTGFDREIWKSALIFSIPLLPHYLAQHVMLGADRIMLSKMASSSDVAIYAVVSAISMIATIVWSAVNASLTPYIYEHLNVKEYKSIDNVVLPLLAVYAVVCMFVTLIAPEVLFILAPKEYSIGIYAVPPIAGVAFLNALYNTYASIEFYHKKSKVIAGATVISCVTNILLNYFLIPRFGFIAAAYTTLVSNVVLIIVHYSGYRMCQKEHIFSDKIILFMSFVTMVACELCILLYQNDIIRYFFIGAVILITVLFREKLLAIYRKIRNKK